VDYAIGLAFALEIDKDCRWIHGIIYSVIIALCVFIFSISPGYRGDNFSSNIIGITLFLSVAYGSLIGYLWSKRHKRFNSKK
jgi:hypothetical protein